MWRYTANFTNRAGRLATGGGCSSAAGGVLGRIKWSCSSENGSPCALSTTSPRPSPPLRGGEGEEVALFAIVNDSRHVGGYDMI